MGRIVYCPLTNLSVTTDSDQDIFQLLAGSSNPCKFHGFELYSASIVAEAIRLRMVRRTSEGDGGTAVEVKADQDDGPITAVVETLATTPGSAGDVMMTYHWEQLGPLIFLPTPAMQIKIGVGDRLALNLQTALGVTTVMDGHIVWEEI